MLPLRVYLFTMHAPYAERTVDSLLRTDVGHPTTYTIIDNGSDRDVVMPADRNVTVVRNASNRGVADTLEQAYVLAREEDARAGLADSIVGYFHDDVVVYETGWSEQVQSVFADDQQVALASFFGASQHGHPDLRKGYDPMRVIYRGEPPWLWNTSGQKGLRPRRVALIDGFSMFVRRSFLDSIGGWSWWRAFHHGYDHAISAFAHKRGQKIMWVPARAEHIGLQTRTLPAYERAVGGASGDDRLWTEAIRTVYDMFHDILPYEVHE